MRRPGGRGPICGEEGRGPLPDAPAFAALCSPHAGKSDRRGLAALRQAARNSRTNRVAGLARIASGAPICSILPMDITTTRSASSIASS